MITCPWCGTNYPTFQSNCKNCGGPLQSVAEPSDSIDIPMPPSPPRQISDRYIWRLLSNDSWAIAALIFSFMGVVFCVVGAALTFAMVTAFIGIPFLLLGFLFLGAFVGLGIWRYLDAQKIVNVLREGEAARGQVVDVQENYSVSINGRYPWVVRYQFRANGRDFEGKITSMNKPGAQLQAGKAVCVLYAPTTPEWNSIYPHP